MRDAFVKAAMTLAEKDKNVYLITGDLGFGVLKPFWEAFPKQFINAGIAEQAMTGVAAGLAKEGKTVFTYSIGNFPTLRCLEQIRNDCAYHDLNVKIVCVGGGFTYGPLGMSHHATEDIAIMRALPGVVVAAPADAKQATALTNAIYKHQGTCYLRLGRGGEADASVSVPNDILSSAIKLESGSAAAIFFTGALYAEAKAAAEMLKAQGVNAAIYSFPVIKPIDTETIKNCAKNYRTIVTVEEHNIVGGFGSAVCEVVAEINERTVNVVRIGLNDVYSVVVGSQQYLKEEYHITAQAIADAVRCSIK